MTAKILASLGALGLMELEDNKIISIKWGEK